jgi:hypothetical protein
MTAYILQIIRERQNDLELEPPSIRYLARRLKTTHRKMLDACEDADLNINVGFSCGNGVYVEKYIGDYTVENLNPAQP